MGKGETRQLIDIGDVLGALRKRDDVTTGSPGAIAPLNGTDCAEGVKHLAGHGLELATLTPTPVLAYVLKGTTVHERVLAKLHLDEVEAEGLCLPDELLHRTIGRADGTCLGKRALDAIEIFKVLVRVRVHEICGTVDRGTQPMRHDDHRCAMGLGGRDRTSMVGQRLAHLDLVAPEVEQLV